MNEANLLGNLLKSFEKFRMYCVHVFCNVSNILERYQPEMKVQVTFNIFKYVINTVEQKYKNAEDIFF